MVLTSLTPQNEQFRRALSHAARETPKQLRELKHAANTYLHATQLTFEQGIDTYVQETLKNYQKTRASHVRGVATATAVGMGAVTGIAGFLTDYQPAALTLGLGVGLGTYGTLMGLPHIIDALAPDRRKRAQLRKAAIMDVNEHLVGAALDYEQATQAITRKDDSDALHRRVLDSYFTLETAPANVPGRPRTLRFPHTN